MFHARSGAIGERGMERVVSMKENTYLVLSRREILDLLKCMDHERGSQEMAMSDTVILEGTSQYDNLFTKEKRQFQYKTIRVS